VRPWQAAPAIGQASAVPRGEAPLWWRRQRCLWRAHVLPAGIAARHPCGGGGNSRWQRGYPCRGLAERSAPRDNKISPLPVPDPCVGARFSTSPSLIVPRDTELSSSQPEVGQVLPGGGNCSNVAAAAAPTRHLRIRRPLRWWDRSRAPASNEGSERHCSNLSRSPHRLTLCYLWE
jgi:hypothetical protein